MLQVPRPPGNAAPAAASQANHRTEGPQLPAAPPADPILPRLAVAVLAALPTGAGAAPEWDSISGGWASRLSRPDEPGDPNVLGATRHSSRPPMFTDVNAAIRPDDHGRRRAALIWATPRQSTATRT